MACVKMYSLHEGYGSVGNTVSVPWLGKVQVEKETEHIQVE